MFMTKYREILRLTSCHEPVSTIASITGAHRNTIKRVQEKSAQCGLSWPLPDDLTDADIKAILYPRENKSHKKLHPVDYDWVHKELQRKGVTRSLLYEEYCDTCRTLKVSPCSQSKFNQDYEAWASKRNVVMHICRKPAEKMEVDWAGTTMEVIDRATGALDAVYVFVACLPFSGKIYAEGFLGMDSQCWQTAHVHAFEHFGGVAHELVPDNCKTAVVKHTKQEVLFNKGYEGLAQHYGCSIMAARVRHPKDKANVEAAVGMVTRHAIAALRDGEFFSLAELNAALFAKVEAINDMAFTKKPGSRNSVFFSQEKDYLSPLPRLAYPVCNWIRATVREDQHMPVAGSFYSVPFEYTGRVCDARLTLTSVEIFYKDRRIASHGRTFVEHDYVTNESHRPESHVTYLEWNAEGLAKQAERIGDATTKVLSILMTGQSSKQKALGQGKSLINLANKFGKTILECACSSVLEASDGIYASLDSVAYLCEATYQTKGNVDDSGKYAILRGNDYYKNKQGNEEWSD